MKIENRMFLGIAVFCWLAATMYGIWTHVQDGDVEWVGVTSLVLSGGLLGLTGGFFWFVSRRIDARPEDRKGSPEPGDGRWPRCDPEDHVRCGRSPRCRSGRR